MMGLLGLCQHFLLKGKGALIGDGHGNAHADRPTVDSYCSLASTSVPYKQRVRRAELRTLSVDGLPIHAKNKYTSREMTMLMWHPETNYTHTTGC